MLGLHPLCVPSSIPRAFLSSPLPHPRLVSHCHLHPASGRGAPAQWGIPRDWLQPTNCIQPSSKSKDDFQRPTQFKITHNSITKMLITYLSPRTKYAALGCVHHNYKVFLTAPAVRPTNSISFNMNLALLISGKLHMY